MTHIAIFPTRRWPGHMALIYVGLQVYQVIFGRDREGTRQDAELWLAWLKAGKEPLC